LTEIHENTYGDRHCVNGQRRTNEQALNQLDLGFGKHRHTQRETGANRNNHSTDRNQYRGDFQVRANSSGSIRVPASSIKKNMPRLTSDEYDSL